MAAEDRIRVSLKVPDGISAGLMVDVGTFHIGPSTLTLECSISHRDELIRMLEALAMRLRAS